MELEKEISLSLWKQKEKTIQRCLRQRPNWTHPEQDCTLRTWETEAERSLGGPRFRTASDILCQKGRGWGWGWRDKEVAQWLTAILILQRTPIWFPHPLQPAHNSCIPAEREPVRLASREPLIPMCSCTQVHNQNKQILREKNPQRPKSNSLKYELIQRNHY